MNPALAGVLAGAGGGVCQTVVMGPCTFVVTAVVTGANKDVSATSVIANTWKQKGIAGFYPGATAIAARQASNWASRQGFTELFRTRMASYRHNDPKAKLSVPEEACCAIVGGTVSTWNQPFEVARIQLQAAANEGKSAVGLFTCMGQIVAENGPTGLFKGIVPRICLGIWQTLFMVT